VEQNTQGFKHQAVTEKIIGVFFEIYNDLGHGFLESVYHKTFELALSSSGLKVYRKIEIPVWGEERKLGNLRLICLLTTAYYWN